MSVRPWFLATRRLSLVLAVGMIGMAGTLGMAGMAGCEEDAAPEYAFPTAWKSAGLEVSSFAEMKDAPLGDGRCWAGQVSGMQVITCRYDKPEKAAAARAEGLTYVGKNTGVSLNSGVWLIAIADRDNKDPTGKAINEIAKVFLAHSQVKPGDKAKAEATKPESPKTESTKAK